ncbi:MAG: hypothetical protein LAT78_12075, partial [Roseinatronobacter sp.]|nr:hypothetical protein [Roseinatronobacter sp.]
MDKQIIIRGVSILCVGAAAAVVFLPGVFSGKGADAPGLDLAAFSTPVQPGPAAVDSPKLQLEDTAAMAEPTSAEGPEREPEPEQASAPLPEPDAANTLAETTPEQRDCTPSLTVKAAFDGLMDLALSAPCAPDTRFVIGHGDLAFSAYLGP